MYSNEFKKLFKTTPKNVIPKNSAAYEFLKNASTTTNPIVKKWALERLEDFNAESALPNSLKDYSKATMISFVFDQNNSGGSEIKNVKNSD